MTATDPDLLWPSYTQPSDLAAVEAVPLAERGLPETTYDLLTRAATRWPQHPALTVLPDAAHWQQPQQRTFAELRADVHRYANLLHDLGVRRGDAVAFAAPNCAELIPALLAAQLAGIAAPINGGLSPSYVADLVRRCGARVLVAAGDELSPQMWATARELAGTGTLDTVLVLRPTGAEPSAPLPSIDGVRIGYLTELAAEYDAGGFAGVLPRAGDLAAFFHTGGTTGVPKLAAHTQANEVVDAWLCAIGPMQDAATVAFAALPLFHVNALVVTVLAPLFTGRRVVWAGPLGYRDPELPQRFWQIVQRYRISAMSAVPTVYAVLSMCPVDADISSLRHAFVGAAALPAAVRTAFEQHTGVRLVEGYGLTEATCVSARSFAGAPRPGSVGQRLPYQGMRIVAPGTGVELPAGATGVLAISGPTVFAGYVAGQDDRGHVIERDDRLGAGWLETGDLARLDADGFLYLAGRAKDLIIRGGHNIDPAVVEDALLSHPSVSAAAAVGRPDAHSGEVPVAYVTLAPGAEVTAGELRDWAAGRVPESAAAPRAVTVLEALPMTAVGKLYKPALRADAAQRAVAEALADLGVEHDVTADVPDGSVTVTVDVAPGTVLEPVRAVLDRFTVDTRIRERS